LKKSRAAAEQPAGAVASPADPDVPLSQICKQKKIPFPLKSPHFVVDKTEKKIRLFDGDTLLKTYPVAFGPAPEGPKEKSGDGRTPEGEYYLIKHSSSGFGKCFYIAYPNKSDAERGLKNRLINRAQYNAIARAVGGKTYPPNNTALGGLILLHGTKDRSRSEVTATNWTLGCIAMENAHILELLDAIPDAARPAITILPLKKK
jgi:murein L,D-transpeptidase YafK